MTDRRKDTTEAQRRPETWQKLAEAFSHIAGRTQCEPLWAIEDPLSHTWKCNGGDKYSRGDFCARAAEAGKLLGCPKGKDLVDFWLDHLYLKLEKTSSNPLVLVSASMSGATAGNPHELQDMLKGIGTSTRGREVRALRRVSLESAAFCAELGKQAHAENEPGEILEPMRSTQSPSSLNEREKKILEIIQLGSSGRQYCREIDNAGVPPPRVGVWKDGPRKYVAAYDLNKPWRHRIEDEKAKIRRKANAPKTRRRAR